MTRQDAFQRVSKLCWGTCRDLLQSVSIQSYVNESLETLHEAVVINICDGTISDSALRGAEKAEQKHETWRAEDRLWSKFWGDRGPT